MPLPEDSQAANKSTTDTPSEVRLARNTQPCARDNSLVSKRCRADPILRAGQPQLLPATGPGLALGCLRSFQGWAVSGDGDGTILYSDTNAPARTQDGSLGNAVHFDFDGTQRLVMSTSRDRPSRETTLGMFVEFNAIDATWRRVAQCASTGVGDAIQDRGWAVEVSTAGARLVSQSGSVQNVVTAPFAPVTGKPYALWARASASDVNRASIRMFGVTSAAPAFTDSSLASHIPTSIEIGASPALSGDAEMKVAEVFFWRRMLSDGEVRRVESSLSASYGVTVP